MRPPRTPLVTALAVAALSCAPDPMSPAPRPPHARPQAALHAEPIRPAALAPGDSLAIDLETEGCFHRAAYHLTLLPDATGAAVTVATREGYTRQRSTARGHVAAQDLVRLDALLEYYRSGYARTWCTSSVAATLTLYRDGRAIAHERYEDSSCAGFGETGVLSFEELVALVWGLREAREDA